MTPDIWITLTIICIALLLFVWERWTVDVVAVFVMVAFVLSGVLTPHEGLMGFSNPATVTVGAMFILSAALFKTGVLNNLGKVLISAGRTSFTLCILVIMLVSGLMSAFINDTAVVAMLMPVVIQVAREADISPSKLLMPLSFGALLGGVCTLIGTSTNILVSGILEDHGLSPIGMFELSRGGVFFFITGVIYMIIVSKWLLPNRKANVSIQQDFGMDRYLAEIRLLSSAKSVGQRVSECALVKDLNVEILQIIRADGALAFPMPYTELREGDILKVRCDIDKLKKLTVREGIEIKGDLGEMVKDGFRLHEMLVPPNSHFIGKSLAELQFRESYRGASVLAIRSRDTIIHERIGRTPIKDGDILLVRADDLVLPRLRKSSSLIMLSDTNNVPIHWGKTIFTLSVIIAVMVAASVGLAPIVLTAITGVIVLVMAGMISTGDAYRSIEWKVIFMLAGVLSMGTALSKTGAAMTLSAYVTDYLGAYGPHVVLSFFYGITFLLTNFMSNNATAALLIPIALVSATTLGVDARPFIMAVTFGASLSFMTPIGYQTNTMILAPGNYRFRDFLVIGTPLNMLLWLLATWMIPKIYPF